MTASFLSRRGARVASAVVIASGVLGLGACSGLSGQEVARPSSSGQPTVGETEPSTLGEPSETSGSLTVAFLGDSYVAGEGARRPQVSRWTTRISERFGWREINLGLGGTGYTSPGPEGKATTYSQRVDAVGEADPDVVVVSGGRNDVLAEPERVRVTAVELFTNLLGLEGAPAVVVVAPLWDASDPPVRFRAVTNAVRRAARQVGVEFVPVPRQPLAGRPELMSADQLHPTDRGYARIARALAPRLQEAVGEG